MTGAHPTPPAPHRNRGRMILIAVLALSLLGNALSLGAMMKLRTLRADLMGPAAQSALFPRDQRKVLRTALSDQRASLRPYLHDLSAARAAVVKQTQARPFDRAAVDQAMQDFRLELDKTATALQTVIGDALEAQATADGAQN